MHILKTFSYKTHTTQCIIIERKGMVFLGVREMEATIIITKAGKVLQSSKAIEWKIISGFPCNFLVQLAYDADHLSNISAMFEGPRRADFTVFWMI